MRRFVAIFLVLVVLTYAMPLHVAIAQMSSSSFIVPSETMGDTGGTSTSSSFHLSDTMGETSSDSGQSSASFSLGSGFQTMTPEPVFTFTISSGSVTLSPPPTTAVIGTGSTILTTSTNAPFGYTTTVVDDGKFRSGANLIADVSDGAVGPIGTEEYGIGLTGADRAFADDEATVTLPRVAPGVPRIIASSPTFGANRATTVTFKMSTAPTTITGAYSHVVTFVSSPNY